MSKRNMASKTGSHKMKQRLNLDVRKPPLVSPSELTVYFLEWEAIGCQFVGNTRFHNQVEGVKVHIFCNRGTEKELLPSGSDCVAIHQSLTDSPESPWIDLMAYLISFYTRVNSTCHHCAILHPKPRLDLVLVASEDNKYKELAAILKANKVRFRMVSGWKKTIMDFFSHVCRHCKLIFNSKEAADLHDRRQHNFLCYNRQCHRSKRENGFFTRKELDQHLKTQRFCRFCPHEVFCNYNDYEVHMKLFHKPCPCPCGDYYQTNEDFIEHYYSLYPLPCLEDPDCESRFKNIEMQAFHHKSSHGSILPYFCMACYRKEKLVCLRTGEDLIDHAAREQHKEKDYEFAVIPTELITGEKSKEHFLQNLVEETT